MYLPMRVPRFGSIERPRGGDQHLRKIGVDTTVVRIVGVGKRRMGDTLAEAHMVELLAHGPEAGRKRVVLAGCTSGGAGFRMFVCLKRSLNWMG